MFNSTNSPSLARFTEILTRKKGFVRSLPVSENTESSDTSAVAETSPYRTVVPYPVLEEDDNSDDSDASSQIEDGDVWRCTGGLGDTSTNESDDDTRTPSSTQELFGFSLHPSQTFSSIMGDKVLALDTVKSARPVITELDLESVSDAGSDYDEERGYVCEVNVGSIYVEEDSRGCESRVGSSCDDGDFRVCTAEIVNLTPGRDLRMILVRPYSGDNPETLLTPTGMGTPETSDTCSKNPEILTDVSEASTATSLDSADRVETEALRQQIAKMYEQNLQGKQHSLIPLVEEEVDEATGEIHPGHNLSRVHGGATGRERRSGLRPKLTTKSRHRSIPPRDMLSTHFKDRRTSSRTGRSDNRSDRRSRAYPTSNGRSNGRSSETKSVSNTCKFSKVSAWANKLHEYVRPMRDDRRMGLSSDSRAILARTLPSALAPSAAAPRRSATTEQDSTSKHKADSYTELFDKLARHSRPTRKSVTAASSKIGKSIATAASRAKQFIEKPGQFSTSKSRSVKTARPISLSHSTVNVESNRSAGQEVEETHSVHPSPVEGPRSAVALHEIPMTNSAVSATLSRSPDPSLIWQVEEINKDDKKYSRMSDRDAFLGGEWLGIRDWKRKKWRESYDARLQAESEQLNRLVHSTEEPEGKCDLDFALDWVPPEYI